jgi:GT2 family glycosyltransferase
MNLQDYLKQLFNRQTVRQSPHFHTIIEDHYPESTLLSEQGRDQRGLITEGKIPVTLLPGVCIRFHIIPNQPLITGLRLRFGTYCRINQCHITVRFEDFTHSFNARQLIDNQSTDLLFPTPQSCIPGQPIALEIYSEDAAENHTVALWCSQMHTAFVNHLNLKKPLILPEVPQPRVSIVIPVFNKALYTYNCLLTLHACDHDISKEVIIINNASSDETPALLAQLQGAFKIINNIDNQGFVQACQQGAEIARGEFILFLNNDTQVTPGWLSNLLKVMDSQRDIGITGSKLIYPDGRLQEAGGIIFNDASGWNYGRLQEPTAPPYNQSREVDYCSGASLMIRKTLWHQIGGFDMRYAPAYYEDTDLCFAARQAGYKVYYCHDSEVIHHEGITAGTDIQSGYKAYQAINRKKFQAKWWNVLSSHPPTPPQSSPNAAAFRFMTGNHFRIPENKIIATHFLAQGWAANFWSYLNLNKVDQELELIKEMGFNTVILLIPWIGFQTKVDPITYYEDYFTLFQQLLEKLEQHHLQVILRLGYSHDNGPDSEPEGFLRQIVIAADPIMLTAWCDYLDKFWGIVQHHSHVLGGFITWEDFFFMDLTHTPLETRRLFGTRTGYQDYLEKHYTLEEISARYQHSFQAYSDIPIPASKSKGIDLFCAFWDNVLIETLFKTSKKHFPLLTMEVRTDCDYQEHSPICHHDTFDLSSDTYLTTIYYTPAWGAPNDGRLESSEDVLKRMQFMFDHLRTQTHNVFFIDQFNFIDNTPGFEQHTGILPEQIPDFLAGVAPILQSQTIGYSLWTLHDVRANALKNGLFERDYPIWEIEDGQIVLDNTTEKKTALLNSNGILSQSMHWCVGIPYVKEMPFQLDFKVKSLQGPKTIAQLAIIVLYNNELIYQNSVSWQIQNEWQDIHLENIPFGLEYTLKLENKGTSIFVSDLYLYQVWQENGIIDARGKPKSFYQDLLSLNQQLTHQKRPDLKSLFQQQDITPEQFEGVYPDHWMGKTVLGLIAKPVTQESDSWVIKAYIPDTWHDYHNRLTLTLDDKHYPIKAPIKTGYNEILVSPLNNRLFNDIVFFQIEAENLYSPDQYDAQSEDNRKVSLQLIEFGFNQ